ncbi:hypothetical protein BJ875DRAFT_544906 [Amylocarpus encephaloides]|uniref:Uncharacterized protein n=1 Tax=Amylocarpus encephaloides TaxID=45428 RepID=A0A9P7YE67_9HELO|nr:hypothetical protein BJ875DRAFT_544906 [Amylocarpus encephaloides]
MPPSKNYLYVAMYILPGSELRYHWALLIGPKDEPGGQVKGYRYHVKADFSDFVFEEKQLKHGLETKALLGLIIIVKIEDESLLIEISRNVPVKQQSDWNCASWVQDALKAVAAYGKAVGASNLNWEDIHKTGMEFIGKKVREERFKTVALMEGPKPTYDLLEGRVLQE